MMEPKDVTTLPLHQVEEAILGGTTARRGEAVIARGEGCYLWDTDGRRYLDFTSAQGVAMLGHCHPALSAAIASQASTLISCPNFLYNDVRARFAAKLAEVLPPHLNHIFLANSGAEAIDGAIKFARLATGRTKVIAFRSSFHGRTVGAVSLTWEKKYREPFLPLLDVVHLPYNNLEKVAEALDECPGVVMNAVEVDVQSRSGHRGRGHRVVDTGFLSSCGKASTTMLTSCSVGRVRASVAGRPSSSS